MIIDVDLIISNKLDFSFKAHITGNVNNRVASLRIDANEIEAIMVSGENFFNCLIKIRKYLEKENLYIGCQGSVKNGYPSPMSFDMSLGTIAYTLQLGEPAKRNSLVNIFDPVPIASVGTVEEQNKFYAEWMQHGKIQ